MRGYRSCIPLYFAVRWGGLEPPRLSAHGPQPSPNAFHAYHAVKSLIFTRKMVVYCLLLHHPCNNYHVIAS
jgi:hypothetical protein